jgi:signal transduction histidine kinase
VSAHNTDRERLAELADEQEALRRIATLVARSVPAADIFEAVTEEVHRLWHPDVTILSRREPDGAWTVLAVRGTESGMIPIGHRTDDDDMVPGVAELLSGRPVRIDARPIGTATDDVLRAERLQAWVASPVMLMERTWGVIWVISRRGPLPIGAEDRLADFALLVATAVANAESQAKLMASRTRIAAAADQERRRVVRDLHDGAQQRLVQTIATLKLARRALEHGPPDAAGLVGEALQQAEAATEELRDLARGILPAVLTQGGLAAAVTALVSTMPIPVTIDIAAERFAAAVEATAYCIVAEALTNTAKHSQAQGAEVTARASSGTLEVRIRDDGGRRRSSRRERARRAARPRRGARRSADHRQPPRRRNNPRSKAPASRRRRLPRRTVTPVSPSLQPAKAFCPVNGATGNRLRLGACWQADPRRAASGALMLPSLSGHPRRRSRLF